MASEALKRAKRKYDQNNTKQIAVKLNKKTDSDILGWIEKEPNKQGYIKQLIRQDIEKGRA